MSRRLSRPSSAASSRPATGDSESRALKAAYLSIFDDLTDRIESEDDLSAILQQAGRNPSRKTLDRYWTHDTDYLMFDDFVNICRHEHSTTVDDLMRAFKKIDINGDGYISLDELYRMLTTRGDRMTRQEVKDMIDEVDENRDGKLDYGENKLDYSEFCNMLMKTTDECKKMSIKMMEKKERKKRGGRSEYSSSQRRGEDSIHGSRTSLRSNTSGKRSSASRRSSLTSLQSRDTLAEEGDKFDTPPLSVRSMKSGRDEIEEDISSDLNSARSSPRKLTRERQGSLLSLRSNRTTEGGEEIEEEIDFGEEFEGKNSPKKSPKLSNGEKDKERLSSRSLLKSPRISSDGRAPSHSSLRSVGRTGSKSSLISIDDMPRPSPRIRTGKVMPAVASSKAARLPEPSNIREWTHTSSKGCFFIDSDEGGQVISHQYILNLPAESNVYITIHPTKIADGGMTEDGPIDTGLYIVRENSSSVDRVVTFTEQRDSKGKYAARCDLSRGRYRLIPFTTGCRLRERRSRDVKEAKIIKKDKDDKVVLSKTFKRALEDIFEMSDLDGNGTLSREEFNWFNMRTSGESVADDEWEVVEGNIELEDGEITKQGFVHLNQMEAEDNDGDAEDLWVTVTSMGFNKGLVLDQACPFKLDVYTEDCDDADLRVDTLEPVGELLDEAVCESVIAKGEVSSVKGMRDLSVYTYTGDARATIVVENKSHSRVKVELDCSKSKNVVSNHRDLVHTLTVPANRTTIGLHLIPRDERSDWLVKCNETIQK